MAILSCRSEQGCVTGLRYLESQSLIPEIAESVKRRCLMQPPYGRDRSQGASACAIYAAYLHKSGNPEKGYSIAAMDCSFGNPTSCSLATAMAERSTARWRGVASVNEFCFPASKPAFRNLNDEQTQKDLCPAHMLPLNEAIPSGLREYSARLLDGFLEEQKAP